MLEIKSTDVSSSCTLEVWINYCKLLAFSRLYTILSKGKKNKLGMLVSLICYLMNIPIRLLKLIYFFVIKNKQGFKHGILSLYYNLYYTTKELKIEILSREIYLNCYTLGKLIKGMGFKKGDQDKIYKFLIDIKKLDMDFVKHESEQKHIEFKRGIITTKENNKIVIPHYIYFKNNAIHSTSSVPTKLSNSQESTYPMPSLIKEGAKKPGSIITIEPKSVKFDNKSKLVPINEFYSVIYEHFSKFEIPDESYKYISEKVYRYEFTMMHHCKFVNHELSKELRCNLYRHALINADEREILEAIKEFRDDVP